MALFMLALGGLNGLWAPLTILHQVDALLAYRTWPEVLRDGALLISLLGLLSLAMALVASSVIALLSRLTSHRTAVFVARALIMVPVGLLCSIELAAVGKYWLQQSLGATPWGRGPVERAMTSLAVTGVFGIVWWRLGTARLLAAISSPLQALRAPAAVLTAISLIAMALHPPVIGGHSLDRPQDRPLVRRNLPDVFLLSLDSLAAADAAVCGSGPTLMPRLRKLAGRATCFTHFRSASNTTPASTATMSTGAQPWSHWGVNFGGQLASPQRENSVARRLQDLGYATHYIGPLIYASPLLHGTYRAYDSVSLAPSASLRTSLSDAFGIFPDSSMATLLYLVSNFLDVIDARMNNVRFPYPPRRIYDMGAETLRRHDVDRPIFMWLHTFAPHEPYLPPPEFKYKKLAPGKLETWRDFQLSSRSYAPSQQAVIDDLHRRYLEMVMYADARLGDFLDTLEQQGRLDKSLIIVTSDHGESFDKGWVGHGGELLHESLLRVPLVIKLPGQQTGRISDLDAGHVDLAPTVLDVVGGAPVASGEGRSLKPVLLGGELPEKPVFAMSLQRQSRFRPLAIGHFAMIMGQYKLVLHLPERHTELYDLASDPQELHELSAQAPETAARLTALLQQHLDAAEASRRERFAPSPAH